MRRLTFLCLLAAGAAAAPPPRRIVSTAPSLTEILFALGLGERVAGVTEYCHYPPEARSKPKIGTFLEPDFERILALQPDLALVIKNPVQVAERLRRLGVQAVEIRQDTVADIFASILQIGALTGRQREAAALAAGVRTRLDQVRAQAAALPRRRVLFLVGRSPGTLQGMVGAASGTFIDELIQLAGGENVLKAAPIAYPRVSLEQIFAADPGVILDMGDFAHNEGRPIEGQGELLRLWSKYANLRAVQNGRVRQVTSEIMIRPGPRVGEAAQEYFRLIHDRTLR